jgi:signal transduction histidine kinase
LLPPLERFVDTASIGLLAWAFLPSPRSRVRTWDWVLGANLALAVVAYLVFTILWGQALASDPDLDYNAYWQASVWAVWQLALVLAAGAALARSRGPGFGTLFAAMVLMSVGVLLQWVSAPDVAHLPLLQRLANLVAYPLLAVGIYQEIMAGMRVHSRELQDISQASMDQMKDLLNLFEAGQRTSSSLELSKVLDNAVEGIARVLGADQCAIVFPDESDSGTMRLVAIYNPTRQGRGEEVTFPRDYQLKVQQAIRRRKPVIVEESDNIQLKMLFALLGSGETGPLLVQPLVSEKEAIGAIIAGNSRSRRSFTANEAKLCQSMAGQVVAAIQNARLYESTRNRIEDLSKSQVDGRRLLAQTQGQLKELSDRLLSAQAEKDEFSAREAAAREARNDLEIRLVSSRAEVEALSERMAVLETDLAQAHASAEAQSQWHEEELARLRGEWEELAGGEEPIQPVLQAMTAGVLVSNAHGLIEQANVAARFLLEAGGEELQGLPLEEVITDERWREAVSTAGNGKAVRLPLQVGSNTLLCDLAPLPDSARAAEEVYGLVVVLQDISTAVDGQRNHLEAIASLSEEMRTPVTTIMNYVDLLLSESVGDLDGAQRKFLTRIKAGAERLAQMSTDLARQVGDGEEWTRPHRRVVDVNKLVEATVAGSHEQLDESEVTLELDLPGDLPTIKADPDYLRRVLSSLLSNACLASSEGGQIRVTTIQSATPPLEQDDLMNGDGFVIISVKDSGGGLSDEAFSQIFDRSRPVQTPAGLGESGAGLALAKTLVEAQGGRLWVESETGIGTTFNLVLPVNSVGEYPAEQADVVLEPDGVRGEM